MEKLYWVELSDEPEQIIELPEGSIFMNGSLVPFGEQTKEKTAHFAVIGNKIKRNLQYFITCVRLDTSKPENDVELWDGARSRGDSHLFIGAVPDPETPEMLYYFEREGRLTRRTRI